MTRKVKRKKPITHAQLARHHEATVRKIKQLGKTFAGLVEASNKRLLTSTPIDLSLLARLRAAPLPLLPRWYLPATADLTETQMQAIVERMKAAAIPTRRKKRRAAR